MAEGAGVCPRLRADTQVRPYRKLSFDCTYTLQEYFTKGPLAAAILAGCQPAALKKGAG
jgi:hypothetical protein